MSLSVAVKTSNALVLASDSLLTFRNTDKEGKLTYGFVPYATKLFALGNPHSHIAVVFVGDAATGIRSANDLIAEFSREQPTRKNVETIARELHAFLLSKGLRKAMFYLAGYDQTSYYGNVFQLNLPGGVTELHPQSQTGVSLGGMSTIAEAVLKQLTIPTELFPIQATVELAKWLIRITIEAQSFGITIAGLPTVGGSPMAAILERGKPAKIL